MNALGVMIEVLLFLGIGLLLLSLGWPAAERGRVHRASARLRRKKDKEGKVESLRAVDWWIATGTMVGWL
jgi:hypothetical protein